MGYEIILSEDAAAVHDRWSGMVVYRPGIAGRLLGRKGWYASFRPEGYDNWRSSSQNYRYEATQRRVEDSIHRKIKNALGRKLKAAQRVVDMETKLRVKAEQEEARLRERAPLDPKKPLPLPAARVVRR